MPLLKYNHPVSRQRGFPKGSQRHQAANNILRINTYLSSSPTNQELYEKSQVNIRAHYTLSQLNKMYKEK
jgi:hypothetical protein